MRGSLCRPLVLVKRVARRVAADWMRRTLLLEGPCSTLVLLKFALE